MSSQQTEAQEATGSATHRKENRKPGPGEVSEGAHGEFVAEFDVIKSLSRLRHWLPRQNPIRNFVHHNTLHAFQELDFEDAVLEAGSLFNANSYLPVGNYREYFDCGKIRKSFLPGEVSAQFSKERLAQAFFEGEFTGEAFIQRSLWEYQEHATFQLARSAAREEGLEVSEFGQLYTMVEELLLSDATEQRDCPRARLIQESGIDLNRWVHPILIRLISSYLDQGICHWRFPHGEKDFYHAVLELNRASLVPIMTYVRKAEIREFETIDSETAVKRMLDILCPDSPGLPSKKGDYLRETLLAHPGWSGMVGLLEEDPGQLRELRPIRLIDFLAVKLILECQALRHRRRDRVHDRGLDRLIKDPQIDPKLSARAAALSILLLKSNITYGRMNRLSSMERLSIKGLLTAVSHDSLAAVWHRALEKTTYGEMVAAIDANVRINPPISEIGELAEITAVFCIDDREASLRRYLEQYKNISTEAIAGFFGLDFCFKSLNDHQPEKLCPVPMTPRYVVTEKRPAHAVWQSQRRFFAKFSILWHHLSSSLILGWLFTTIAAPWIFFQLVLRTFRPALYAFFHKQLPVGQESDLEFIRPKDEIAGAGLIQGYSFKEMADRVGSQLRGIGLVHRMSPLVVMVAHGSSSVNNPYFAAYDCGACSGRPGAANAKTFARMANHPEVRKILALEGLTIPDTTLFVGAFHDTCRDTLTCFDERFLDEDHLRLIKKWKRAVAVALVKNAKERARRFESVLLTIKPRSAYKEAFHRSVALFEPRPEFNHASNAFCIVGRRALSQGLFMDRRVFLQSYDSTTDATGAILTELLSAVIPVCAGINLEYLFSKIDNEVYGSGTKLPHNVASLLGVMNGVDADLRTGLPRQMVEIHDPVRMLFIVEKNPAELAILLQENPAITQWFEKRWAFLVAIDPIEFSFHDYVPGKGFKALVPDRVQFPIVSDVGSYVMKTRDTLQFALIDKTKKRSLLSRKRRQEYGSE